MDLEKLMGLFFVLVGLQLIISRGKNKFQKKANAIFGISHSDEFYIITNVIGGIAFIIFGLFAFLKNAASIFK